MYHPLATVYIGGCRAKRKSNEFRAFDISKDLINDFSVLEGICFVQKADQAAHIKCIKQEKHPFAFGLSVMVEGFFSRGEGASETFEHVFSKKTYEDDQNFIWFMESTMPKVDEDLYKPGEFH